MVSRSTSSSLLGHSLAHHDLPTRPGDSSGNQQRRDVESKGEQLRRRAVAAAKHPAGAALLTAAAAYIGIRASIEAFHRLRRRFLRQLLLDVCGALDALGQTYWLDFGCLLGLHRNGDLILHDNDVDLAVLDPDWPGLLAALRTLLPPRYALKVVTPEGQPESSWLRVYCPLGMADLFGAYSEGKDGKVCVDCGHGDTMHIERELVLPPSRKNWRGHGLNVPHDVEGTLAVRYGPNWRTPAYMDKGADSVEGSKPYARLFRALARLGIRI